MFEGIGYLLRLPGFLFGSLCNIIFSILASIVGNIFGVAAYIFAIAVTPVVFVVNAYSNDRSAWEKHLKELAKPPFFESAFDGRQEALAKWLDGKGRYSGGASDADIGCVTWLIGVPLGIYMIYVVAA